MEKVVFAGTITSVKARIRLLRSFDQIPTHQYQGYTLVLEGDVGGEARAQFKIAVGRISTRIGQDRARNAGLALKQAVHVAVDATVDACQTGSPVFHQVATLIASSLESAATSAEKSAKVFTGTSSLNQSGPGVSVQSCGSARSAREPR